MERAPDHWHRWLTDVRFGGDPAVRERMLTEFLYPVRDKVLDKSKLRPGDTVLDVGTGDGLIAFGALDRLGPSGQVIFSDISKDLLDHCHAAAAAEGLLDRSRFLLASADSLADASVDVVTTRPVLIYVKDKAGSLREFYRVLEPGGRLGPGLLKLRRAAKWPPTSVLTCPVQGAQGLSAEDASREARSTGRIADSSDAYSSTEVTLCRGIRLCCVGVCRSGSGSGLEGTDRGSTMKM